MSIFRSERGESLRGIIYVHRISDVDFTGTATKSFKTLLEMCGDQALRNVVIVTNRWEKITPEAGVALEQELANNFFRPALDRGAQLLRHNGTTESAREVIRIVLENQRVTLQIQKKMGDLWKEVNETAAGKALWTESDKQARRRLELLRELQEILNRSRAGDEELRQEIQREILKSQEELVILSQVPDKPTSGFRERIKDVLFFTALGAGMLLWSSQ